MSSKFGNLAANVSKPHRVFLVDPVSNDFIADKSGVRAYIDIWSADSVRGRDYDKAKRKDLMLRIRKSRTGNVEQDDALEENIAKCAALTADWHLVDPVTREQIKVAFTAEDAADLYSAPGMGWLFVQPWVAANDAANFFAAAADKLIAWAEWQFRSQRRLGSSAGSVGEHEDAALGILGSLGLAPKAELVEDAPPFPEILEQLWRLYLDFEQGIASGGMGPPIASWSDLRAFDQVMSLELEPYEMRLLLRLSRLRAAIDMEKIDGGQDKGRQRSD